MKFEVPVHCARSDISIEREFIINQAKLEFGKKVSFQTRLKLVGANVKKALI